MIIIKDNKKLYPVGKFSSYQHMLYNHNDKCYIAMIENDYSDEACDEYYESERLLNVFESAPCDASGIVYAEYADYKLIKNIINNYKIRHNY